jgi:GT2 family glycosyltransferase
MFSGRARAHPETTKLISRNLGWPHRKNGKAGCPVKRDGDPNSTPRVTCIVLNWNGWQDTINCVAALKRSTYADLTILIVDNGSTNDSIVRIRDVYPEILLIESGKNRGFAGGNNLGIRYALTRGADYIWLLNNDTQPDANALTALVSKALSDRRIGAVASICYYADDPSRVEAWGGARVNLWLGYGRNSTTQRPDDWFDSLNGTSMLVSRLAMQHAGLLDEGFFLYWEDTEFCLRLRKNGWRIAAAPDSRVLHKVNASTGGNRIVLDRYQTASGLRLLKLHSPVPRLASPLFMTVRFVRRLLRLQFARCRSVWEGMQDYRSMLPISPKIT